MGSAASISSSAAGSRAREARRQRNRGKIRPGRYLHVHFSILKCQNSSKADGELLWSLIALVKS